MHGPRPWGLGIAALLVGVIVGTWLWPGGAPAATLDRSGQGPFNCPEVRITRATKDNGGSRAYVFEGPCKFPGDGPSIQVKVRAEFKWLGTSGQAAEIVDVTGDMSGKINTTAQSCSRDPFVDGGSVCTGGKFINTTLPVVWSTNAPLMASRVPTGQVYTMQGPPPTPPPPQPRGQVVFVSPMEGQSFALSDKMGIAVKFAPAVPAYPPKGGVRLEWGRETNGQCSYGMGSLGVPHHSMTQMLGKTTFPEVGRYCLRAMSTPEAPDKWTPPRRISVFIPQIGPAPQAGTGLGASESTAGGSKAQKVSPSGPKINPPTKGTLTTPKAGSP